MCSFKDGREERVTKSQQDHYHVNYAFRLESVHHVYTPPGQTINEEYYLNVLHQLEMQHDENDSSCGQLVICSFIMTMRLLMHHVLCRDFW